ncbi:MAG: transposase [Myxococcota bacterium]
MSRNLRLIERGRLTAKVWVSIEVPHGTVVETVMDRGFRVFSINPKQLDRFRDQFTVAGSKDDRLDARVLADSLRTDGRAFRQVEPDVPEIIELRAWSRSRDHVRDEFTALASRARQQIGRFFHQLL